jgi:hypothetical protein
VEVRVDEGRTQQQAAGIDDLDAGGGWQRRADGGDAPVQGEDVDAGTAVGEGGVADQNGEAASRRKAARGVSVR